MMFMYSVLTLALVEIGRDVEATNWSDWWTYDGISGSKFWSINPEWTMCSKGLHQSPIDIDPAVLLFDSQLSNVHFDRLRTTVTLNNTGRNLEMTLDDHADSYVNVTGGPLAYQYRVSELTIHFGLDNESNGSQHRVAGVSLPGEIQIIGYNSDLYYNRSQADASSNGMFGIAVFIQIGEQTNDELNILLPYLDKITYRGQNVRVKNFMIADILPYTDQYVTYEGSLTKPGCHESVTWIVYNKPIYVNGEFMDALRSLMVGSSAEDPKGSIGNNFRHLAPLNNRPIRTNIDFTYSV